MRRTALLLLLFTLVLGSMPLLLSHAAQSEIPPAEYDALIALHNATNGPNWTDKWSLPTNHPCTLFGITCASGHVSAIDLSGNNLNGTIPPQLGNLANLQQLGLHTNQLSGAIPPELGNLANLQGLYLAHNQLSGMIPSQLGNLASLQYLNLFDNQLSGTIPPQLGSLGSLRWLHLFDNQLSGAIPSQLGNLANLTYTDLSNNQLSGTIPPQLGNLASLRGLYLGDNELSGTIPPQLGNLSGLEDLFLSYNQLSGTIPAELGNLAALRTLDLAHNTLVGPAPSSITNLAMLTVPAYAGHSPYADFGYNSLWTDDAAVKTFLDAKDPDWAATQDVATGPVTPEAGGSLILASTAGGSVSVAAPIGAVTQTVTLAVTPLSSPSSAPGNLLFGSRAFSLGAYLDGNQPDGFVFEAPVTVTLTYTDAQIMGLEEDTLTLYVHQGDDWIDTASTCTPASVYLREPEADRLTVAICHLSEFALFGEGDFLYDLPVLRRN